MIVRHITSWPRFSHKCIAGKSSMIRIQSLFPSRALRNPVVLVLLAMLGLALLRVLLVFGVVAGRLMIAVGRVRRPLSPMARAAQRNGNGIGGGDQGGWAGQGSAGRGGPEGPPDGKGVGES